MGEASATATMKSWRVRVALDDAATLTASGSPFALLPELLAGPRTTLLMALATGSHHFNALEQLARVCTQHRVWSAVLKPSVQGVKQLVVYVPRFSSAERVSQDVQRLAHTIQLTVSVNVVKCDAVPRFVFDGLIFSMFMHELENAGCTIMGEESERQVVLSPDLSRSELSTVIIPQMQWQYDQYRQVGVIEMTCTPAVMKLRTIAENTEVNTDDDDEMPLEGIVRPRIRVLPRLSEGWIVSRFECGLSGYSLVEVVLTTMNVVSTSNLEMDKRNTMRFDECPGPRTNDEFRSYWLQVHGIRLPHHFGGYVRVRLSSSSILTYPARCVTTEWRPLQKQTRLEALDVLREFAAVIRQRFGNESVTLSSPDDQDQKSAVLLPASALLKSDSRDSSNMHHSPMVREKAPKRRMIARDRYMEA